MRELSIEEKAKAYDEALKVLHKYDGANIMFSQSLKEEMFPELKESEDERIRKALIELVKFSKKSCFEILKDQSFNIVSMNEMLTWLEKQVEQKSGWNEDDERIRKELIDAIQGLWDNDALPLPLSVKRKDAWIAWLEKQVKSTDHLWKPADGDDLPEYGREVIVLRKPSPLERTDSSVAFSFRPDPKGWDGISLSTGKGEHFTPKTYGKGGWSIPDVTFWLDLEFPK